MVDKEKFKAPSRKPKGGAVVDEIEELARRYKPNRRWVHEGRADQDQMQHFNYRLDPPTGEILDELTIKLRLPIRQTMWALIDRLSEEEALREEFLAFARTYESPDDLKTFRQLFLSLQSERSKKLQELQYAMKTRSQSHCVRAMISFFGKHFRIKS